MPKILPLQIIWGKLVTSSTTSHLVVNLLFPFFCLKLILPFEFWESVLRSLSKCPDLVLDCGVGLIFQILILDKIHNYALIQLSAAARRRDMHRQRTYVSTSCRTIRKKVRGQRYPEHLWFSSKNCVLQEWAGDPNSNLLKTGAKWVFSCFKESELWE